MTGKDTFRAKIMAVSNQKGGVGKTTTAINLGAAFAHAGRKVLVVDVDPQGNASTGLGIPASRRRTTTCDVLLGKAGLGEAIVSSDIEALDVAPANADLSGADANLLGAENRTARLRDALSEDLLKKYRYILIDCPPSLNLLTVNALNAANSIIVPLQCEFFALEGVAQLLGTVRRIQSGMNKGLRVQGIALTMYDRRNNLSLQVAEDVQKNLGELVFKTIIPRNVHLAEAPSFAMPAMVYAPNCAGSRAYLDLAAEIMECDDIPKAA